MAEVWKDIEGYDGIYQVSNIGNVKSLSRLITRKQGNFICKEKIMAINLDNGGYPTVRFWLNGIKSTRTVHRLVGLAFIPNPENKIEINHIDAIKSNNNVENLEWNTKEENTAHMVRMGLLPIRNGRDNPCVKLTEAQVLEIRNIYLSKSYRAIGEIYGVDQSTIHLIVKRKKWQHI